jgi:hypothetical protein
LTRLLPETADVQSSPSFVQIRHYCLKIGKEFRNFIDYILLFIVDSYREEPGFRWLLRLKVVCSHMVLLWIGLPSWDQNPSLSDTLERNNYQVMIWCLCWQLIFLCTMSNGFMTLSASVRIKVKIFFREHIDYKLTMLLLSLCCNLQVIFFFFEKKNWRNVGQKCSAVWNRILGIKLQKERKKMSVLY